MTRWRAQSHREGGRGIVVAFLLVPETAVTARRTYCRERDRLAALRYDDGSRQGAPSVAAAFELFYRRQDETSARMFWLLPVNPGPDISTAAAAVLAGLPTGQIRTVPAGLGPGAHSRGG